VIGFWFATSVDFASRRLWWWFLVGFPLLAIPYVKNQIGFDSCSEYESMYERAWDMFEGVDGVGKAALIDELAVLFAARLNDVFDHNFGS
jgi:hypothetical protein